MSAPPTEVSLGTPDLERLNQAWLEAWLAKDDAAIEAMMAPEYTYIAPTAR